MGISRLLAILGVIGLLAIPAGLAHGQGAELEIVADGLDNPRGLDFGSKGALFVAEAGSGGPGPPCTASPLGPGPPFCYGPTGAVTRIWRGEQERVIEGLPSLAPAMGATAGTQAVGPHDVSFSGRRGFLVIGLGAPPGARGTDLVPVGELFGHLWRFRPGLQRIADIAGHEAAENPDARFGGVPFSNPYAVLATHGEQFVVDAGANTLLRVRGGDVETLAVFPPRPTPEGLPGPPVFESVPDSIARGPGCDLFVGELTGFPFPVGEAQVYRVSPDGDVDVYASGFTNIIDIAFDRKGNLYVLEFTTKGMLSGDPAGALWRVEPDKDTTLIASEGLVNPTGLAIGHGAAYVSNHGASPGIGEVVRIPLRRTDDDGKDDGGNADEGNEGEDDEEDESYEGEDEEEDEND
jgi:hypothetical protein